ncbi:MAG TPA: hypothetical protein VGQ08_18875 [Nitrospiraceae bacterium]|jgi:hypothetical protein|nr:hypothetical protein [Nitrospiraceae bacterium]
MAMRLGVPAKNLKELDTTSWKDIVSAVGCMRCGGLMVIEQCLDFWDDADHLDFMTRRYVQCGEVSDWAVEQNRQIAAKAVTAKQRKGNARNEEAGAA